jgi:predicted nucleic acid-binding protein
VAAYLLGTNVVAEFRKRAPDPHAAAWRTANLGVDAYVSVLVVGEIRYGIERLRPRDAAQAEVLDRWLGGLLSAYRSRILPVTVEIAQEWGRLGVPLRPPAVDGLLAATARVHRLTLATRNVDDFVHCGIPLVNPFAPR